MWRSGWCAGLLIATAAGCAENGGGPRKVPQPPKPPAARAVVTPKNVEPLKVRRVTSPPPAKGMEAKPTRGPEPVQALAPAKIAPPNGGPSAPGGGLRGDPKQVAAQQLLENGR